MKTEATIEPDWINNHAPITQTVDQIKRRLSLDAAAQRMRAGQPVVIRLADQLPPSAELHAKFLKTCGGRLNAS